MKWVESWADHADCVMGSDLRVWEFSSQDMRQSWKRNHMKWYEIIWDPNGLESYEFNELLGCKKKSIWFHLYLETRFALLRVPQYHLRKQPCRVRRSQSRRTAKCPSTNLTFRYEWWCVWMWLLLLVCCYGEVHAVHRKGSKIQLLHLRTVLSSLSLILRASLPESKWIKLVIWYATINYKRWLKLECIPPYPSNDIIPSF